jgi:hypothetical protein
MSDIINKLRTPKVIGIAIFDTILTIAVALLYSYVKNVSIMGSIIYMFSIGIIIHHTFNIPTMLNYYLGLNTKEDVLEKRKK